MKIKFIVGLFLLIFSSYSYAIKTPLNDATIVDVTSGNKLEIKLRWKKKKIKPGLGGYIWHHNKKLETRPIIGKVKLEQVSGNIGIVRVLKSHEDIKDGYFISWFRDSHSDFKSGQKNMRLGEFQSAVYCFERTAESDPKTKTNMTRKIGEAKQAISDIKELKSKTEKNIKNKTFVVNGQAFDMVRVPSGKFVMGGYYGKASETFHEVTISKDFYIGKYEVTQEQWNSFMGTFKRTYVDKKGKTKFWKMYGEGNFYPVYYVSWEDANEFCKKLSEISGDTYRLPTEAEWEYACRAGSLTNYYWGKRDLAGPACGWNYYNAYKTAREVGLKMPNAWGIYDMTGNLWEFCSDWYEASYYKDGQIDPKGPQTGSNRVIRGGSWENRTFIGSGSRNTIKSDTGRYYDVGFRLVREINGK